MKKVLAIILSVLMLAVLFAGCTETAPASSGTDEPEQITLTFFTNRTDFVADGTYAAYLAEFQKTYPHINVDFQGLTDYANDILTLFNGGEYGDICMQEGIDAAEFPNYFVSFGTVDELKDKYIEAYLTGGSYYDGEVYGLACFGSVNGVVYNKKVFEAAGYTDDNLPKTPDEFLTCLQAIADNTDAIPLYTNTQAQWTLNDWESNAMVAATGDAEYRNNIVSSDAKAFAEGSAIYEIDKLLYDIVAAGLCEEDPFTSDWEACKGMINRGEIGCMVLGNWAIAQMKEADSNPDDIGYMPFPYTINGKQYCAGGCDKCYGISIHSEYQEEARLFVDFMINESGFAQKSGGISIVIGDEMPAGLELFADVTTVIPNPETEVGKLTAVEAEADIKLCDGARISNLVTAAKEGTPFETVIAEWDGYWSDAVASLS